MKTQIYATPAVKGLRVINTVGLRGLTRRVSESSFNEKCHVAM